MMLIMAVMPMVVVMMKDGCGNVVVDNVIAVNIIILIFNLSKTPCYTLSSPIHALHS